MMGRVGVVIASVLAIALHLAAFAAVAPHLRGAQAAGDDGADLVTLLPADPVLAALVAEWDRPPMPSAPVLAPPIPPQPEPAAAMPAPTALPLETESSATLPAPRADAAPVLDPTAPAAPEPVAKPAPKPNPKPKAQPAVPAQKAAGVGGKTGAGQNGRATAGSGDTGAAAKAEWGAAIRARIERRKGAAGGAAGKVILRLVVAPDGQLVSVAVAASSGNGSLDRAALKAVKAAGRFPKAPKGLGQTSFRLPISFAP